MSTHGAEDRDRCRFVWPQHAGAGRQPYLLAIVRRQLEPDFVDLELLLTTAVGDQRGGQNGVTVSRLTQGSRLFTRATAVMPSSSDGRAPLLAFNETENVGKATAAKSEPENDEESVRSQNQIDRGKNAVNHLSSTRSKVCARPPSISSPERHSVLLDPSSRPRARLDSRFGFQWRPPLEREPESTRAVLGACRARLVVRLTEGAGTLRCWTSAARCIGLKAARGAFERRRCVVAHCLRAPGRISTTFYIIEMISDLTGQGLRGPHAVWPRISGAL